MWYHQWLVWRHSFYGFKSKSYTVLNLSNDHFLVWRCVGSKELSDNKVGLIDKGINELKWVKIIVTVAYIEQHSWPWWTAVHRAKHDCVIPSIPVIPHNHLTWKNTYRSELPARIRCEDACGLMGTLLGRKLLRSFPISLMGGKLTDWWMSEKVYVSMFDC